jgi:hypothetical protein
MHTSASSTTSARQRVVEAVRRVAALEYALVEACHSATSETSGVDAALYATRAGVAQVHLFDLGSVLRDLGDVSLSYSSCIRHALLQSGSPSEVLRRLERETQRAIDREDAPEGLKVLLKANLEEHRLLEEPVRSSAAA